jgi:hypothetical protein
MTTAVIIATTAITEYVNASKIIIVFLKKSNLYISVVEYYKVQWNYTLISVINGRKNMTNPSKSHVLGCRKEINQWLTVK